MLKQTINIFRVLWNWNQTSDKDYLEERKTSQEWNSMLYLRHFIDRSQPECNAVNLWGWNLHFGNKTIKHITYKFKRNKRIGTSPLSRYERNCNFLWIFKLNFCLYQLYAIGNCVSYCIGSYELNHFSPLFETCGASRLMLHYIKTGLRQSPVQLSLTIKYNPKNSSNGGESDDEIFCFS